jgi:hypothetical protein
LRPAFIGRALFFARNRDRDRDPCGASDNTTTFARSQLKTFQWSLYSSWIWAYFLVAAQGGFSL